MYKTVHTGPKTHSGGQLGFDEPIVPGIVTVVVVVVVVSGSTEGSCITSDQVDQTEDGKGKYWMFLCLLFLLLHIWKVDVHLLVYLSCLFDLS